MSSKDNNRFKNSTEEMEDFFAKFNDQNVSQSTSSNRKTTATRSSRSASQNRSSSRGRSTASSRSSSARSSSHNASRSYAPVGGSASGAGGKSKSNGLKSEKGKRSNKKKHRGIKGFLKVVALLFLAMVLGVGIYVGIVLSKAPDVDTDDLYSMLNQRSVMYDADGNEIDNLYFSDGNRTIVKYKDIPQDLVNAVIAIEDKKFWTHHGFNYVRMLGAIRDSVFGGGQISGTSTVTQQLARNVYLADIKSQRTLSRKITEAYCAIILEKNLTKEQIMEAYLNTIYLGYNSYGIQAASQAYFSKDVKNLTTLECAALAALPQSPDTYALVRADYYNSNTSLPVITSVDSVNYLYNGDASKDRRDLVLRNMQADGSITKSQMDEALSQDLQTCIKIDVSSSAGSSSYFSDFAIAQLKNDIVSEYGIDETQALNMIYTKGLKIYTTMDSKMQDIVEEEFDKSSNFASIPYVRTNSDGDLLNTNGKILLYAFSNYFNKDSEFILNKDEYIRNSDGSMTLLKDKRLNFYKTEVNGNDDVSIEFPGMYLKEEGVFYFVESGAISIPQGYKSIDSSGNTVISMEFFRDYPDFFTVNGSDYIVSADKYTLKQKTRQPQAAITILENSTGQIKAMMGGRGATGKQLLNRSITPRQPGSSIKPVAVYGPALQLSCDYMKDGKTMSLDTSEGSDWGRYITAGSIINDAPLRYGGRTWPKNWYSGYRGQMTFRTSVEQSVNVNAVKTYQQIGPDYSASMLSKSGITTVDEEGEVNDLNPAALALGGMTTGISPLELTAAYAIFPNGGIYKEPISYTKVLDANNEILFERSSKQERVYDEGAAWIMTNILRSTVSRGIAGSASISSQPVAGKTGTTTDNFDLWFAGFTPQYTAAMWMGNDLNIKLSSGSGKTASFWSKIMGRVCADIPRGSYSDMPSNVEYRNGEYYVKGTYSTVTMRSTATETVATTVAATVATTIVENSTPSTTQHSSPSIPLDE